MGTARLTARGMPLCEATLTRVARAVLGGATLVQPVTQAVYGPNRGSGQRGTVATSTAASRAATAAETEEPGQAGSRPPFGPSVWSPLCSRPTQADDKPVSRHGTVPAAATATKSATAITSGSRHFGANFVAVAAALDRPATLPRVATCLKPTALATLRIHRDNTASSAPGSYGAGRRAWCGMHRRAVAAYVLQRQPTWYTCKARYIPTPNVWLMQLRERAATSCDSVHWLTRDDW